MAATCHDLPDMRGTDTFGIRHILRVFKIAADPHKIVLALGGIILTFLWGITLDKVWVASGQSVPQSEIRDFIAFGHDAPGKPTESAGVFHLFSGFEVRCIRDAVESIRSGKMIGDVRAGKDYFTRLDPTAHARVRGAFTNVMLMGRGVVWMISQHAFFAILFFGGFFVIWGCAGGAISRSAAIQFARDESITAVEAVRYSLGKLFGGFFAAPVAPLVMILAVGILLMVGGALHRIPYIGDVLGGVAFVFALLGGCAIAVLLIGLVGGGGMFWPTIAVEDSDVFDAIARSFSYLFARPIRLLWYLFLAAVYGSFCWLFVSFFAWLAAASTHLFVAAGSGLFGNYGGIHPDKLTALWPDPTFETLFHFPKDLSGWDQFAAALIGIWVMLLTGCVWAFLASFYLSANTVIYYLMRRDVDGTDLREIRGVDDTEHGQPAPASEAPSGGTE
jgi:hypothetical protein